jgi:hypothetical protein
MYWVVFRFAMIPYAVKVLRNAASDYVINSHVNTGHWQALFCYSFATVASLGPDFRTREASKDNWQESVRETIAELVGEETFEHVLTGGPFGRDGQIYIGRQRPSFEFQIGEMTLIDTIKLRQDMWEECRPWTEGLATLFDVSQEELFLQSDALTQDGRRAEATFSSLSELEKIAYRYLAEIGRQNSGRSLGDGLWKMLLCELDEKDVLLDLELKGKAKQVLNAVRKRGHQIHTWNQCYDFKLRASLEDGRIYSLRREVTHALHNAAKKAAYQLSKIWKI